MLFLPWLDLACEIWIRIWNRYKMICGSPFRYQFISSSKAAKHHAPTRQISKFSSPTLATANEAMAPQSLTTLFFFVSVVMAFLVEGSIASPQDDNQFVNGSNYWVVKIAEEACLPGNHDDASTEKIFRCYFEIPKTETFLGCQFKTFGHYLNNERNMNDFCNRWNETFVYYACNQQSFADAGQSAQLPAIVEKLNLCQAKVLGLGQFNQTQAQPQRPSGPASGVGALFSHLQQLLQALGHGQHDGLFGMRPSFPASAPAPVFPPPGRK